MMVKNAVAKEKFREMAMQLGVRPAIDLLDAPLAVKAGGTKLLTSLNGGLSECVCRGLSVGGQMLLEALLVENRLDGGYAALVDVGSCFEPVEFLPGVLENLLCVQVKSLNQALRCLDLLLRDDNFSLVTLDARAAPSSKGMASSIWYRLRQAVRSHDKTLFLLSSKRLSAVADHRFELSQTLSPEFFDIERSVLRQRLLKEVCSQLHPTGIAMAGVA